MVKRKLPGPYKYPGELGRPSDRTILVGNSLVNSASEVEHRRWKVYQARHDEVFSLLFDHYKIDPASDDRFVDLAFRLAHSHVPALSFAYPRKVGRPRDSDRSLDRYIANTYGKVRGVGRPVDSGRDAMLRYLLTKIVTIAKDNGYRGRGAITSSLTFLLREEAAKYRRAPAAHIRKHLPAMRKWVSAAKKKFPEIASKLSK